MLKSDHFGIEINAEYCFMEAMSELKSDHFGIEISTGTYNNTTVER